MGWGRNCWENKTAFVAINHFAFFFAGRRWRAAISHFNYKERKQPPPLYGYKTFMSTGLTYVDTKQNRVILRT